MTIGSPTLLLHLAVLQGVLRVVGVVEDIARFKEVSRFQGFYLTQGCLVVFPKILALFFLVGELLLEQDYPGGLADGLLLLVVVGGGLGVLFFFPVIVEDEEVLGEILEELSYIFSRGGGYFVEEGEPAPLLEPHRFLVGDLTPS